jgi:hypothetical protein
MDAITSSPLDNPQKNKDDQIPVKQRLSFSKLPREIRDEIWSLSLPGCRLVEADLVDGYWKQVICTKDRYACDMVNLLHICHESRQVGLKHYQPLLINPKCFPVFFFDPQRDVLSIGRDRYQGPLSAGKIIHANPLNNINGFIVERLAIRRETMHRQAILTLQKDKIAEFLWEFPNVTELFFVQSAPREKKNAAASPTKKGWQSWHWNISQIDCMGRGLARSLMHLESAWNMAVDCAIFPDPLVGKPYSKHLKF